jgi:transcriptional regulator NrdR family protein
MDCPICKGKTKVLESRKTNNTITRKRECVECFTRFSTEESIILDSISNYLKKRNPIQVDRDFIKINRAWTDTETERLMDLYLKRVSNRKIAESLGRSYSSVSTRISFLKKKGRF